ncbi:MAG: hypothetical protein QOJ13_2628 [Gaiellales bacterium]|jgi:hypothetical protein|nr:hypothetical protein [Gaiellales bacterium]
MMTPLGAVVRGLVSGAVGTLAMDLARFARYRVRGGQERFVDWEFSSGLSSWDEAPAPAQLGKRLVEGVFLREVPPERAALVNDVMHWAYGTLWGGQYGIVAGSLPAPPAAGSGIALGTAVWASDYVIMPLAKLYKPIWEYDPHVLAKDLGFHWVYGLGTAAAFRLLSPRDA